MLVNSLNSSGISIPEIGVFRDNPNPFLSPCGTIKLLNCIGQFSEIFIIWSSSRELSDIDGTLLIQCARNVVCKERTNRR